jgi:RHS repeat-associated protein
VGVNADLKELRVLGLGQGAEIGAAVFLELSGQTYVPTHDQNGNVTALFIPSGECLETYRYTAFGEELASTNIGNPWRFSSKRHDPETGFLYFGQRYYAADLGRWITPDPLEFEDGPNLYAYVHNNPLTSIDLYGLFDGIEDYDFADRNSYSDFVAYPQLGQGIGNAYYNHYFGDLSGAAQNNVVPIDEEKRDSSKNFAQDCEHWASKAMPVVGPLSIWGVSALATFYGLGPVITACRNIYSGYRIAETLMPFIKSETEVGGAQGPQIAIKDIATNTAKQGARNRLYPDKTACGPHTRFRRDPETDKINHYETFIPQTNPRNPNPWQTLLRFDGPQHQHYHFNKITNERVYTPHIHDPNCPGGVRMPLINELPRY